MAGGRRDATRTAPGRLASLVIFDVAPPEPDGAALDELAIRRQCCYCGRRLTTARWDDAKGSDDHVIPRARGGSDFGSNIVRACQRCNYEKACRTPFEWVERWYHPPVDEVPPPPELESW